MKKRLVWACKWDLYWNNHGETRIFNGVFHDRTASIGARIAQMIECLTKKPNTILMWVQVPLCSKLFFSPSQRPVQAVIVTISIQPPCAIICISICACVKNPKQWQPHHYFDTRKYGKYCSNGCSSALVAAVSYPSKTTPISHKRQWKLKYLNK